MREKALIIVCFLIAVSKVFASVPETKPELVLQTGHSGSVRAVAISPDGKWLASGSQDSTVKLWNLQKGNLLRTLYGHNGRVNSVAISADGQWIASAADDNSARVWNLIGGNQQFALSGHNETISSVAFNSSAQILTASSDLVRIWDPSSGREVRSIRINEKDRAGKITLSADGRYFVTSGAPSIPTGYQLPFKSVEVFRPIKIYEVSSGKEVRSFKIDISSPFGVYVISPDSRFFARRMYQYKKNRGQSWIQVIDLASGKEINDLIVPGDSMAHSTSGIAFSSNSRWLAVQSDINQSLKTSIYVFDVLSGRVVREISLSSFFAPTVNIDVNRVQVNPFVFSPDNNILALGGGGSIQLWNPESGTELGALRTNFKSTATRTSGMSPDMKDMQGQPMDEESLRGMQEVTNDFIDEITDEDSPMTNVFDTVRGEVMPGISDMMPARSVSDRRIQFSPDTRWIITEQSQMLRLWDIKAGTPSMYFHWQSPIAFSTDSKLLAVMELNPERPMEANTLSVRNTATLGVVHQLTLEGGERPREIAFGSDGSWYAIITRNNKVRILDSQSGKELRNFMLEPAATVTLSADARYVAIGSKKGGLESAHAMATGMPFTFPGGSMSKDQMKELSKQMQKQSKEMAKVLSDPKKRKEAENSERYEVQIYDTQTGTAIHKLEERIAPWTSGPRPMTSDASTALREMKFSPDGRYFAVENIDSYGQRLNVYETASKQMTLTIPIYEKQKVASNDWMEGNRKVRPVFAFSPDSKTVAVGSQASGYAINLWNVSGGQIIRTLPHQNRIDAIGFSSDGKLLVSLIRDSSELIWDASNGTLLATLIQFQFAGPFEWLAATPDGYFDGSPAAWQQIMWRFSTNTFDITPVETFFNDFYYPGLLEEVISSRTPKAPRNISQIDRRQPIVKISGTDQSNQRNIHIQIEVTEAAADSVYSSGSGVRDVRLFRNGILVKRWSGDVLKGQTSATLQTEIPVVSGKNVLVAYGFNHDNVKSSDAQLVVNGAETLKRKGVAYVVAVGVNQYENPDFNLKYASPDAQTFVDSLSQAQTKLGEFEKIEPIVLFDQNATKEKILAAFQKLESAQPEDAVFVYFAGHGTAQQSHFYMIPYDLGYSGSRNQLDEGGIKTIISKSISDEDLEQAFEKIGAGQIVFVIDACNSGQALEAEEKRRGPMNSKGLAQLAYEKGMYVLAAAQGYQAALEAAKLGHGYLTYALVEEGMKSKSVDANPQDGLIVATEWLSYAANRVPQMQGEKLEEARLLKHDVASANPVDQEQQLKSVQQPRLFYRSQFEIQPLIIWKQ